MEIRTDRTFVLPLCNFSGLSPLNCGQLTSRPLDTPREEAVAMPWHKCILHASLRRAMNRARLRLLAVSSRLVMFEDLIARISKSTCKASSQPLAPSVGG